MNIYYQQSINNKNSSKYIINIFSSYLKEIQKKFGFVDSTFLLKALNEMKKYECKNIKKIGCIEKENVFLKIDDMIENEDSFDDNNQKIVVDLDKVKNSLIDNIMNIVYNNYLSDKKRTDKDGNLIYPQIPNILTGKDIQYKDNYLININKSKSNKKNEEHNEEIAENKSNKRSSPSVKKSSTRKKKEIKNKRFSFNEYFKEDNDEEEEN